MQNYLDIAKKYHENGFRVIPISDEKRPTCKWKQYQTAQTLEDIETLFKNDCHGIAVLTGIGGLECIDVDLKYDLTGSLMPDYIKTIDDFRAGTNVHQCTVVQTKSGGFHILYRCEEIEGNLKLASRPATKEELTAFNDEVDKHNEELKKAQDAGNRKNERFRKPITDPDRLPSVLLETRGEGGYIVAYPTPGYRLDVGLMSTIPTITPEQRKVFINVARSFNQVIDESSTDRQKRKVENVMGNSLSPWGEYDQKADVVQLLETYGWKNCYHRGSKTYLRRPGKSNGGPSGNFSEQHGKFVCFSTSTEFEAGKGYSPTAVLAQLEYNGDFSAASKDLYQKGFGDRFGERRQLELQKPIQLNGEIKDIPGVEPKDKFDALEFLYKRQIKIHEKPNFRCDDLRLTVGDETFEIAGLGMLGLVSGQAKSRKSTLLTALVAAGVGKKNVLGFDFNLHGKNSYWIDTEQPEFFAWITHSRMLHLAGLTSEAHNHKTFGLRDATPAQRLACIEALIESDDNIGFILIDGALDLVHNMNDIAEAQPVAQKFMEWTKKSGALVMTVIHENRGEKSNTIGHLGAFLTRKCDFNIQTVSEQGDKFTTVKSKAGRTRPFENFEFTQDANGYPILDFNRPAQLPDGLNLKPVAVPAKNNGNISDLEPPQKLEVKTDWATSRPNGNDDIPF